MHNLINTVQPISHTLHDDGIFPNNAKLPLLIYSKAINPTSDASANAFEKQFNANHWPAAWRNGIFGVHHYHSTAHEVLGIYAGHAEIQFGGEQGPILSVEHGDVVVIPAGVAHKNRGASSDFAVVGAYPKGQRWDSCYGDAKERPSADDNISQVSLPKADPLYGVTGPLLGLWAQSS